jgi:3-hydroxyisobutyrate dehydrogenase
MPVGEETKQKVGFIGLGRMGAGMASNMLVGGADLIVFDPVAAAMDALTAKGARPAANLAELTGQADIIFTSLPGPSEVEQVVLGEGGIVQSMSSGKVLFELSTSSRSLAMRIHEAVRAKGGEMFDAPVSGGPAGARSGELVLWIGGDEDAFERHVPLLKTFCIPHRVGEIGTGIVTKLAHNMLGYMLLEAQAEAFTLATKAGLDPLDFWEALRLGMVGRQAPIFMLTQQFLANSFGEAAFAQRLALKDVRLALQMADELGVPMRLAQATREDMEAIVARGEGESDSRTFMKLQKERAGVEIEVPRARIDAAVERARSGR